MNPDERAAAVKRLTFLVAAVLIWAAAIFYNLVSMQILRHQRYLAFARRQQEHEITVQAPRGYIYDRTGHPLAISMPVDSVFVNPLRLPDISVAAEVIAPILNLDQRKLEKDMREAADDHRGFLWVKRKVSAEESRRLRSLGFDWIEFQPESVREYPDDGVAAHLIGGVYQRRARVRRHRKELRQIVAGPGGHRERRGGCQKADSGFADGQTRATWPVADADDRFTDPVRGRAGDQSSGRKHKCRSGTVIAMNPKTGEIYALANYPTYNPAEPAEPQGRRSTSA